MNRKRIIASTIAILIISGLLVGCNEPKNKMRFYQKYAGENVEN